jgi:hypothetical protein
VAGKGTGKKYFPFHSPPLRSQLTSSPFWQAIFSLQEQATLTPSPENVLPALFGLSASLQSLIDETNTKLNNLPKSLSRGPVGERLKVRLGALAWAVGNLETLDLSPLEASDLKRECDDPTLALNQEQAKILTLWQEVRLILASVETSCGENKAAQF